MERVYPYLCHNLKFPDKSPVLVLNEAQDARLDDEWENLYGVDRGGPAPKKKVGRPPKGEK